VLERLLRRAAQLRPAPQSCGPLTTRSRRAPEVTRWDHRNAAVSWSRRRPTVRPLLAFGTSIEAGWIQQGRQY